MLKKTITGIIFLLLVFTIVTGFDYRQDNWYSVEDWEVEVCSKWGGREKTQTHTGGVMSTEFHKEAATIQGKVKEQYAGDKNIYIYEISWYLQPMEGSVEYEIILKGEEDKKVRTGSASANAGDAGYYATENTSNNYDYVVLDYDDGKLKAPIVK